MRPAVLAIVLANLVPFVGVLGFGWSSYDLFALYWVENLVVALFTVLRFWTAEPGGESPPLPALLFMTPFFLVHYGMFTFVHGVFIQAFLGDQQRLEAVGLPFGPLLLLQHALAGAGALAVLGLLISHGVSFVTNFLRHERQHAELNRLMFAPYGRVIAMHLTLLAGGALLLASGSPTLMTALLVVAKTVVDIAAHRREHRLAAATID
ncbi:MAG: hypothetical protein H6838_14740 [Planctomycetes bacterium]|nr:hypothetical protein [Planctomycetota bacterium]MCB9886747.1 hypothetical protein [Planctomycetota bacterium]